MDTFSVKHNLQKLIFVSENTFATTFYVTMGAIFASFSCHIYFDNSANPILLMSKLFPAISETLLKRCFGNPKVKFLLIIIIIVSNICLVNNLRSRAFVIKWASVFDLQLQPNSDFFGYKIFLVC